MEPHQPDILSPSPVVNTVYAKLQSDFSTPQLGNLTKASENKAFVGVLDVYIHQARDIHNICIYQNQDVYAKLSLTSDPEETVSTKTINGGGRNPIFDENVRLNVRTIDSSLRCEVWMLSRVRNYLEDQLLGFTLVPLSDILIKNGKPAVEFSLSSSDIFHSPAGSVELTLTYNGASPDVLEIPTPHRRSGIDDTCSEQIDMIEFPDPNLVSENECMASEYFGITYPELNSKITEQSDSLENDDQVSPQNDICNEETVVVDGQAATDIPTVETTSTVIATEGSHSAPIRLIPESVSGASSVPESQKHDVVSESKVQNTSEVEEKEKENSAPIPASTIIQPAINVTVQPEPKVVQQEIVDMYMKSMQQFTEALAKMKLPMDIENASGSENGAGSSSKSASADTQQAAKDSEPSPRVFYGSRAFF